MEATMTTDLTKTSFLRANQLIGQSEVTPEQAAENRKAGKGPRTARPAIAPLIPWKKTRFWQAVQRGEFPAPIKLSEHTTVWRSEDVKRWMDQFAA